MKKKQLTIFDAGVAFVLGFILAQFTSVIGVSITKSIMSAYGKTSEQISAFFDTPWGYLLQAIFMNIAFVLVFVWYARRIKKQDLIKEPTSNTLKYVGKCILIGVVTLFLLSGILNYFQLFVDKLGFTSSSLTYKLNSPKNYIISLISLALIPAVCEELIFRGVLVNTLKHKGKMFAIILSSIMFSIFHFSPSQLIYPMCFGLILGIVYLRTNNILFPIILHFINNALSISIQYFGNSSGEPFTHSVSMLMYAIITFAIWISIMIYLFKDFKAHTQHQLHDNEDISLPDKNPANSNTQDLNQQDAENSTLNNLVFYGSLGIMLCIYIMLLML